MNTSSDGRPETPASPARKSGTSAESVPGSSDRTWPLLITAGLLIVVVVNFAFIWIAISGADEVTESYVTAER